VTDPGTDDQSTLTCSWEFSDGTQTSSIGRPMIRTTMARDVVNCRTARPTRGAAWTTLAAAAAAHFPTVLTWDTSDRDTSPKDTVAVMVAPAERGRNGSVALMHCGPNETPYVLPDVIAFYRHHGSWFVSTDSRRGWIRQD
jgi:peptidoglycan/xylan/chitin deacetylase (PgdA/CDA1 family)